MKIPLVIHDKANRIKIIRQPIETSKTKQNAYRAIKLMIIQAIVVMALVIVLLSTMLSPFYLDIGA